MELQFVGDIKAVRVGDKFRATGKLQSRRTGNYIEVATEIDIKALLAEARSVYSAARAYLSAQGQEIEALPTAEGLMGMGRKVTLAEAQSRRAQGKSLNSGELALLREYDSGQKQRQASQRQLQSARAQSTSKLASVQKALADEKKKQMVQAKMRSEAAKRMNVRRAERKGFEDQIKELKDQAAASVADASRQAELSAQAEQYEARLAQVDESMANMQVQYETQLAQVQAMPAAQVAALPQAAAISQVVDAQVEAQEAIEGMGGGWGWLKNVAKKFKKALAVVFRNKIVKGLVKAGATVYGGPAGAKMVDAAYGGGSKGSVKSSWKVPGLGITAESARTWIRLLEAAKVGDANSVKVLNRIKLMARLRHPKAVKTFWLLRDIERLLPEVKASLARGDANVTTDQTLSEGEPKAVPDAMLGIQLLGMGASESQTPVKIRCVEYDAMLGWRQIPFSAAMGKKKKPSAKQVAAVKARAAVLRARQQQQRNQPTAANTAQPGVIQPGLPTGQPFDPYYGQSSGSQAGYPQGYDPYGQGYDPYQQASAAAPVDPYAAAYAATPPNYDPNAQAYAAQAQAYGDYSAVQNQPGFDPYNPASYGY